MAYGRYRRPMYRKRRTFRKRPINKYSNALNIARRAFSMAKIVAGVVNSEKKYYDKSGSAVAVDTTPTVTLLTDIDQGDGATNRDGNSISIKSLMTRMDVNFPTGSAAATKVRCMIVRDRNHDDTPVIGDILQNTAASVIMISPYNIENAGRFNILYDQVYYRDSTKLSSIRELFKPFFNKKDFKGNPTVAEHVKWNSGDGDDIDVGHLYLVFVGNAVDNLPTINWWSRVRFYDN